MEPWAKRADESTKAFEAFVIYRDMGPARSQEKVAAECEKTNGTKGKHPSLIARWSSQFEWRQRVAAYDEEIDRRKRLGDLRAIEKMRERQTAIAMDMQELGQLELQKLLKKAKAESAEGALDPKLLTKLIEAGTKLERVNRGEPGEIVETHGADGLDLTGLTVEELRTLKVLRAKIRARKLAESGGEDGDES